MTGEDETKMDVPATCPLCDGKLYGHHSMTRRNADIMCFTCGFRMSVDYKTLRREGELARSLEDYREMIRVSDDTFGSLGITTVYPDKDMEFGMEGPTKDDIDNRIVATRAVEFIDSHMSEVDEEFQKILRDVPEEEKPAHWKAMRDGSMALYRFLMNYALNTDGSMLPPEEYMKRREEIE